MRRNLEECEEEYKSLENEFKKWEAKIQKERMQFYSEKKMKKSAHMRRIVSSVSKRMDAEAQKKWLSMAARKGGDCIKREKEDLHRRIVELVKKLDAKQALELALKVIKESFEDVELGLKDNMDGEVQLNNKLDAMQKDLKDKEQEIEDLEGLNRTLIIKERRSNDELQEARKDRQTLQDWCFIPSACILYSS